jgi:hypothetical protein
VRVGGVSSSDGTRTRRRPARPAERMTTAVLLFLIGLAVGMVAQRIWSLAVELLELYRQETRG